MKLPIRASSVGALAVQPLRPVATRTSCSKPLYNTRRGYTVGDKAKEKEPGGQRQLIMAACLAIPAFGILWLRGGKEDISGAGRGANQEYKEHAEGNE
ncbi:uncharacterized protein N7477_000023 [Penicillium maclennaniae]|uniref:uncharacterized protein n=1 Tax=Penicillium maclennaniae TaxID=1343394 RepID=UPI00253FAAE7|nr:uncharacterized protein N7477_000023 [Penicillium maclennaniae]KAJ5683678.1 hypothetical protein N7477_000023 [Penicillium maclennaniae]